VTIAKTKFCLASVISIGETEGSAKCPCGVCVKRVRLTSIQCAKCNKCLHTNIVLTVSR